MNTGRGKQEKKETGTVELTVTVEEYRQIPYLPRGIQKRNIQKIYKVRRIYKIHKIKNSVQYFNTLPNYKDNKN